MDISKAALGALIGACLVAGASGAYLITRKAPASRLVAAPSVTTSPAGAVEKSEAIVNAKTSPRPPARTPGPAVPRVRDAGRNVRGGAAARGTRPAMSPPAQVSMPEAMRAPEPTREAHASVPPVVEPVAQAQPEPTPTSPPAPEFLDLVVSAESVIGLQMETTVSSARVWRIRSWRRSRVT